MDGYIGSLDAGLILYSYAMNHRIVVADDIQGVANE